MLKRIQWLVLSGIFMMLPFSGCDIARQAQQASNLARCDFRIQGVNNVNFAGVQFQTIKTVSDLTVTDAARVMGALAGPAAPLSLNLNLEARNPNTSPAGLNHLDWILFIDDIQMTTGMVDRAFTIPAKGTGTVPVAMSFDLKKVLSGKSASAMLNFCLNLAGVGNKPTRFKVKLKPTLIVAGTALSYPGYITVNTEYGGK